MNMDYTEIALLQDGRNLEVLPIERSEIICEQILERSYNFWQTRVVPGKRAYADMLRHEKFGQETEARKCESIIQSLEPSPTAGSSYKQFLSERFRQSKPEAQGNKIQLKMAQQYDTLLKISNYIENQKSFIYNTLLNEFNKLGTYKIDFGKDGYVRFNKKLTNNVKNNIDQFELQQAINELNRNYGLD